MSVITEHQDVKKEKILDAAYQRFSHYGYSKTTMNEIAGDLYLSKALLYYYFPDKSQLYTAVMLKVADDYLIKLKNKENTFTDLRSAFEFQINTNHDFITTNYNFFDFFRLNEQNLPDSIWGIVKQVHLAELELLVNAIHSEVQKGVIKAIDHPNEVVSILLDALYGVSMKAASNKKAIFPQKEQLAGIRERRLILTEIFVKGLMY